MPRSKPLRQLDEAVTGIASHIHDYTKSPSDFTRKRKLDAKTLIRTALGMQGNSLNAELYGAFPDIDARMTASAYEQAKGKLSPDAFRDLFLQYNKTMGKPKTLGGEGKYRVYAVDGCKFNVPYMEGSEYAVNYRVGKRKDGEPTKPFAMLNANLLYDLEGRTYEDCAIQTMEGQDERSAAIEMLGRIDSSSPHIVIMDRGYAGFNMYETCNRLENCNYIIRVKTSETKEIAALPDRECDVEMEFRVTDSNHYYARHHKEEPSLHLVQHARKHYKEKLSGNTRDSRWDFGPFCTVKVRVVKFRINDPDTGKEQWEVLVTNLNRFEFPLRRMKKMYHKRWGIETSFRELKYAIGAVNFHSRKPEFIRMELYACLTMFNAASRHVAALNVSQAGRKHAYAIDFKMACHITRDYYRGNGKNDIYIDMLFYTNPVRPGRKDKRNMKPKTAVWFVYRVA